MEYLLKNKYAKIILSIIWGLGLATLFKKVCHDRDCIIYKAPSTEEVLGNTYKYNGDCYKYNLEYVKCTADAVGL